MLSYIALVDLYPLWYIIFVFFVFTIEHLHWLSYVQGVQKKGNFKILLPATAAASRIKCSQVMSMGKFDPAVLNFCKDFWASALFWKSLFRDTLHCYIFVLSDGSVDCNSYILAGRFANFEYGDVFLSCCLCCTTAVKSSFKIHQIQFSSIALTKSISS